MSGVFNTLNVIGSALGAHSSGINTTSDNIANMATTGYKTQNTKFVSMVSTSGAAHQYVPGGVSSVRTQNIDQQGTLSATTSGMDMAIDGKGFFMMRRVNDPEEQVVYSRDGSFQKDNEGYIVRDGWYLQGWKTDVDGNVQNNNLNSETDLEPIQINALESVKRVTSKVELKGNLSARMEEADPPFEFTERIFDSLGRGHDLRFSFSRMTGSENRYKLDFSDIDGETQIKIMTDDGEKDLTATSYCYIDFDAQGQPSAFKFTDGTDTFNFESKIKMSFISTDGNPDAETLDIDLSLGDVGTANGLTSFEGPSRVTYHHQNGLRFGNFENISFDEEGFVNAHFDNGMKLPIYKIPLANFTNVNGMKMYAGNILFKTPESGSAIIGEAQTPGFGTMKPGMLEASQTDMLKEFTDMTKFSQATHANMRMYQMAQEISKTLLDSVR